MKETELLLVGSKAVADTYLAFLCVIDDAGSPPAIPPARGYITTLVEVC